MSQYLRLLGGGVRRGLRGDGSDKCQHITYVMINELF